MIESKRLGAFIQFIFVDVIVFGFFAFISGAFAYIAWRDVNANGWVITVILTAFSIATARAVIIEVINNCKNWERRWLREQVRYRHITHEEFMEKLDSLDKKTKT